MKKLFFLFLLPSVCFGQVIVQSQIVDEDTKQSIPMANVRVLGTTQGTLTNIDGKFKITLVEGQKIAVS